MKKCTNCDNIKDLIPLYKCKKDMINKKNPIKWICFPCFKGKLI